MSAALHTPPKALSAGEYRKPVAEARILPTMPHRLGPVRFAAPFCAVWQPAHLRWNNFCPKTASPDIDAGARRGWDRSGFAAIVEVAIVEVAIVEVAIVEAVIGPMVCFS